MVAARKGGGRTEGGRLAGEDSGPEGGSVFVFALGRPAVTPGLTTNRNSPLRRPRRIGSTAAEKSAVSGD